MGLRIGEQAPEFELPDQSGKITRLSDFRGNTLVLYFYPRDDTPGCTTEACDIRDNYAEYQNAGIPVVGISPDKLASHKKFQEKYSLPFTLLADENHAICEKYGVWGRKKFMGREFDGVLRSTFIIDQEGKVVKIFEKVKPAGHGSEILEALKTLNLI